MEKINTRKMSLFNKKKRETYCVIKVYKIVDINDAKKINIKNIIRYSFNLISSLNLSYPDRYEINFGQEQWKSKKSFDNAITKMKDSNIFDYTASFLESKSYFSFDNNILNIVPSSVPDKSLSSIEIAIPSSSFDLSQIKSFFYNLYNYFQYDYGYLVELMEDFDFGSERKIKKKFFGNEITVQRIDTVWRFHSVGIQYGFIKDIYPINILNKSQMSQSIINKCINEEIGVFKDINKDISLWILNNEELKNTAKYFKESKYLMGKDAYLKCFLDSDESKQFYKMMEIK